jgi:CelD/BcsL family acetyltransferase involved in cellulose biosynthesis
MLIARKEEKHVELAIGYAKLWRPKMRALTFIYEGLLGRDSVDNCQSLLEAVLDSLRRGEADLAFFNLLREDSALYPLVRRIPGILGRDYFVQAQVHRSMRLPQNGQDPYGQLSSKVRKNQRWQAKRLFREHDGRISIRCFRNPEELEALMDNVESVASKTYQRALGVGFTADDGTRARLGFEAARGWLRAFVLYIAERPSAFWIGRVRQGIFYSSFMGYDPAVADYSPGMYLIMRGIDELSHEGNGEEVQEIDWGFGDAQYKQVLGNREWREGSVYIFARKPRGILLSILRAPVMVADLLCRKAVGEAGLLATIKKSWRQGARRAMAKRQSPGL